MLFVVDENARIALPVTPSTFGELAFRERSDIQEWILACPRILGEDLFIITAEFDQFDKTAERLDLLAVDRRGKLVVVELKRTAVGSKADLQALRYAAYCSTLGLDDIGEMHAAHIKRRQGRDIGAEEARQAIMGLSKIRSSRSSMTSPVSFWRLRSFRRKSPPPFCGYVRTIWISGRPPEPLSRWCKPVCG